MNIAYALDYIPRRMRELGFDDRYVTRYRHVLSIDKKSFVIKAHNQVLLFITPPFGIKIESEKGVFDLSDAKVNEQQYEHTGEVKVSNNSMSDTYLLFIQVIPQHKKRNKA